MNGSFLVIFVSERVLDFIAQSERKRRFVCDRGEQELEEDDRAVEQQEL